MFSKKVILIVWLLLSGLLFGQDDSKKVTFTQDEIVWMKDNLDKMRYAPNPSWAPGDFIDETGEHQGIISDYIRIFQEQLNVEFKQVNYKNWKGMYAGLLNDEIDFLGAMQVTEERKEYFAFTQPILNIPLVLIVNKDKNYDFSDHNLSGMNISVIRDYISQDYLTDYYHNFKMVECDDELEALIKTSLGTTDAAIVDIMTASFLVEKYGITNLSIGTELGFTWHLSFAFQKKHEIFARIIDKILLTIDDSQRREILNKWVNIPIIPKQNFVQKNYKVFVVSLIVFLVILIGFLFYSTLLRRLVRKKTFQLNNELKAKNEAIQQSQKNEARLESLFELSKIQTDTSSVFLDYALREIVKLTDSIFGLLYKFDNESSVFNLSNKLELDNVSITHSKSFDFEHLDKCKSYFNSDSDLQVNICRQCSLFKKKKCPISNIHFHHTIIFPVIEDGNIEALLYIGSKTPYNEKDSQQIVLLIGAIWKLLSKQKWQEELISAKAKAEESDKLKSAFLANLSHEIRTPMNGIIGFAELLDNPDLSDEDKKRYISIIHNSSDYLLSVITDIIEISKIESGLVKLNKSVFAIDEFFEGILHDADNMLVDKSLKIIVENKGESSISIQTDDIKLRQIILNLVSNAIKYTDEGSVTIEYQVKGNCCLEVIVRDTGAGIDEQYHEVIFERFRQGDKELAIKKGGTGIGLSITSSYVKMLGGSIILESELGKGSEFIVEIPVLVDDIIQSKQHSSNVKYTLKDSKIKVLVAEDHLVNYQYIKSLLNEMHCTIVHAKDGKEAIELFNNNTDIDLVLLDIKMPILDGYQVIKLIREQNAIIPVFAQTAYALHDDYLKIKGAGFNEYITKPIDKKQLLHLILKYTNQTAL